MNWQSPCSALQTALFSPNWSKGAVVSVVSAKKKKKEMEGGGWKGQEIHLKMLNHFTLFLHFTPSFDLSAN